MAHINITQNNFSTGEVNPIYYGRKDLALHLNGAKRLKNLDISPSGSLHARAGTEMVKEYDALPMLHKFVTKDDKHFLLVFVDDSVQIYDPEKDKIIQTEDISLSDQNRRFYSFAQGEDCMFISQPQQPMIKISVEVGEDTNGATYNFTVENWHPKADDKGHYLMPYEKFFADDIEVQAEKTAGIAGRYYLTLSKNIERTLSEWKGQRFYINGSGTPFELEVKRVISSNVPNVTKLECNFIHGKLDTKATTDWSEPVFSKYRGWPSQACFHQGRLVLAKSGENKSRLWMSKTGDADDFSLGAGRDDEAIDITLHNNSGTDILHLLSGRHLQIFTAGGEWVIPNKVVTPSDIEARQRTTVGAIKTKKTPPLNINGVTIFCDAVNNEFHEYTYTEIEDSYIVSNLSRLAPPLTAEPIVIDYDKINRRLCCVLDNGEIRILWLFTQEKILAWSSYETANGLFRDYVNCKGDNFVIVERSYPTLNGATRTIYTLEKFSDAFKSDGTQKAKNKIVNEKIVPGIASLFTFLSQEPLEIYAAENDERIHYITRHMNTEGNKIFSTTEFDMPQSDIDDNSLQPIFAASGGLLDSTNYIGKMYCGLAVEVAIEALPPNLTSQKVQHRYRLMEAIFDVQGTPQVHVDSGLGYRIVEGCEQGSEEHKKIKVSGCGWKNLGTDSPWKIRQYAAPNFNLLGAEMHLSVN